MQLNKVQELKISRTYSKRNQEFSNYIGSQGFHLDSWSFYILRDFFYEFSLLNFVSDETGTRIFPLYGLGRDRKYRFNVKAPSSILSYWPRLSMRAFMKQLVDVYLNETGRKWNRVVDLLALREKHSVKYRIPELLFDKLLNRTVLLHSHPRTVLSVGTIELRTLGSFGIKSLHLPLSNSGLPYLFLRIDPGGA